MEEQKVNAKISVKLREKLINKKYKLKVEGIGEVIEMMYNTITKHKMWPELEGLQGR